MYKNSFVCVVIAFFCVVGCSKKVLKQDIAQDTAAVQQDQRKGSGVAGKYANGEKAATAAPEPKPARFTVYFGFDSYDITPEAELTIAEIRSLSEVREIIISGNTCPIGTDEYNDALGMRRARAVAVAIGKDAKCVSNGERELITGDPEQYALNRRCEIIINR